jgi:hypothetical protein
VCALDQLVGGFRRLSWHILVEHEQGQFFLMLALISAHPVLQSAPAPPAPVGADD